MKKNTEFGILLSEIEFNSFDETAINMKIKNFDKILNPKIKNVYGCICLELGSDSIDISAEEFSKILKINSDEIGFEASYNEVRTNDYIEDNITLKESLRLALIIMDIWIVKLKYTYSDFRFCFIISCEDPYTTLRFHKIRENELLWISTELDKFNQPIAYKII